MQDSYKTKSQLIDELNELRKRVKFSVQPENSNSFNDLILQSLTTELVVLNSDGEIVFVNEIWKKFARDNGADKKTEEGIGLNYFEVCNNAGLNNITEQLKNISKGLQPIFLYEYECSTEDNFNWFIMHACPLAGGSQHIVINHINITERKRSELQLIMFKNMVESSTDTIGTADRDGKCIYINKSGLEQLQYDSFDEISNKPIIEFHPFDEQGRLLNNILPEVDRKGKWSGENIIKTKSGKLIPVLQTINSVKDAGGKIIYYSTFIRDLTEIKKAEEILRNSEKRFREILEDFHLIALTLDKYGNVLFCNEYLLRLTGYKKEELIGKNWFDNFVPAGVNETVKASFITSLSIGKFSSYYENEILCSDGSRKTIKWSNVALKDETGKIIGSTSLGEDLTEQKKIKKAFLELETKLNHIINSIPIILFATDKHGVFTLSEGKGLELLGIKKGENLGRSAFDIYKNLIVIDRENRKLSSAEGFTKILNGEITSCRVEINGILFEAVFDIIKDAKGEFESLVGISIDISEKKKIEEALSLSESKFESVVNSIDDLVFLLDKDFKYSKIFGKYLKNRGKDPFLYLGRTPVEMLGDAGNVHIEAARKAFEGENVIYEWEDHFTEKTRYFQTSLSPVRDVDDNIAAVVGVARDISEKVDYALKLKEYNNELTNLVAERTKSLHQTNKSLENEIKKLKAAEIKIADQLNFLRIIIDTIPNPVYIKDMTGKYTDCNPAFEKFHCFPKDKIIGKTAADIVDSEAVKFINIQDNEVKEQDSSSYQIKVKTPDGKVRDVIASKRLLKKADGTAYGIVGILVDISELKILQEELKAALAKEKELSELKSNFISTASHEFRTPLTSIRIFTDLIKLTSDNKLDEYTENIFTAVDQMIVLIDDVLRISRSESGLYEFNPVKINFYHLCRALVNETAITSNNHNIQLNYLIEQKALYFDEKIIRHILQNLLNNAVKFSPSGGVVELNVNTEKDHLIIKVRDKGIGISAAEIKHIFDPFYRTKQSGKIPGSGLGLTIVKNYVELHNGKITVHSKINKGSTFILHFLAKEVFR